MQLGDLKLHVFHPYSISSPMLPDPNSFSNYNAFLASHLHLCLAVDFSKQILRGRVEISVKRLELATIIFLDATGILVHSVKLDNEPIPFSYSPKGYMFGGFITIDISFIDDNWPIDDVRNIQIEYETTEDSSAVQWLTPEQTEGKIHPFLFTQCQAIHARTLLPCQDSPTVKATYSAEITLPKGLTAVMSANEFSGPFETDECTCTFKFKQTTPIPSYLIALAAGNLQCRSIGPRSQVWSEPEVLDRAAWEFADAEAFIKAGEEITGFPYIWGRYDILVLPPSFPYGGMENPCLTFLTPSLLAGDRSLVDVLAHEISHSWTGNLVTACNWEHFWLNEGFTMFLERKIIAKVHNGNEALRQFNAICGLTDLNEAIKQFGSSSPATLLVPDLSSTNPDDVFSSIPYEKGHTFLAVLEELVGGPVLFDPFFQDYIKEFAYKSICSGDFVEFFTDHFGNRYSSCIDWYTWLSTPGDPPRIPNYDRSLMEPCEELINSIFIIDELDSVKLSRFSSLNLDQKLVFLDLLSQKLIPNYETISSNEIIADKNSKNIEMILNHLENEFALKDETNVEICLRWYLLALRTKYTPAWIIKSALNFVLQHGRMKYNRPIYRELFKLGGKFRQMAQETFKDNRKFYHPIAANMIEKDLSY